MNLSRAIRAFALIFIALLPMSAYAADPVSPFYAVGDSIANQLKAVNIPTTARDGASPSAVLGMIRSIQAGAYKDKIVILSSGASNLQDENIIKQIVPQQIQALKSGGAKNVILLGVGPKVKSTINGVLQQIASEQGVRYSPLAKTYDGIHPESAKASLASIAGGDNSQPYSGPLVQNNNQQQQQQQQIPPILQTNTALNQSNSLQTPQFSMQPFSQLFSQLFAGQQGSQPQAASQPTQTNTTPLQNLNTISNYQPTGSDNTSVNNPVLSSGVDIQSYLNSASPEAEADGPVSGSSTVSISVLQPNSESTFAQGQPQSPVSNNLIGYAPTNDTTIYALLWSVLDGAKKVLQNIIQSLR